MGQLRLRSATDADADRLGEIARAAYGHYVERMDHPPRPMLDDYAEVVRAHDVVVAERDARAVGLIVLLVDEGGFFVDNVAVDPAVRGTGVGRALLEHAEGEARRGGFTSVYLLTHETMTENLALYTRIGYVEEERRGELVYLRKQLT